MSPAIRQLNQAIEKSTLVTRDTADSYVDYLGGEYDRNYRERKTHWDKHYEEMRTAYRGHLYGITGRGIPLKDMNIAIVGPGIDPLGRDLGLTEQKVILPSARTTVIADFSEWVVQEAHRKISEQVHLRGKPLLPMQIDLTDCISTVYARMIRELLQTVEDEDHLAAIAHDVAQWDIPVLRQKLEEGYNALSDGFSIENMHELEGKMVIPDCFRGGGINSYHSLKLTVGPDHEPLPVQSWYLPMVLAGTGAAAEHYIWDTFERVTSDPHRGARPESDKTTKGRLMMMRDFHYLIANYNTIVARKAVYDILNDNPESTVLAVTDVNTHLNSYDETGVDRLHVSQLEKDLARLGVEMTRLGNTWNWHDEAEHYHGIASLEFRRMASTDAEKVTAPPADPVS